MEIIRGTELSEDLLQSTSPVGCFYGKMSELDKWRGRRVLFFVGGPLNISEVRDRKKGKRHGL